MPKTIRIGTRDSQLALWQAKTVQQQLEHLGHKTEIVPVKSTGDLVLNQPIYELGITGVFTRTLDIALLNEEIDIAVHSLAVGEYANDKQSSFSSHSLAHSNGVSMFSVIPPASGWPQSGMSPTVSW